MVSPRTYVSEQDVRVKKLFAFNRSLIKKMNYYKRRYNDCIELIKFHQQKESVYTEDGNFMSSIWTDIRKKKKLEASKLMKT